MDRRERSDRRETLNGRLMRCVKDQERLRWRKKGLSMSTEIVPPMRVRGSVTSRLERPQQDTEEDTLDRGKEKRSLTDGIREGREEQKVSRLERGERH